MKEYLLPYIVIISFVFLYSPPIQAAGGTHIILRTFYCNLHVFEVQALSRISIVKKHDYGFYGYSTINHSYEDTSIDGDTVVVDHSTNLMWHQSGSDKDMDWKNAKQWVADLNSRGYAGHDNWRLPTVEEAISLLEMSRNTADLYIDGIFDIKQSGIWTGDENDYASYLDGAWSVRFSGGYGGGSAYWCFENASNYVRPVRPVHSMK